MFDLNLDCQIHSVKVKTEDVGGTLVRRCLVVLAHPFTSEIAGTLGANAKAVLKGLEGGDVSKAELPIDAIAALGAFTAVEGKKRDTVKVKTMFGKRAVCKAPKEDGEEATMLLEFEFPWAEDAWLFLGRHCSAQATVVLTKAQQALDYQDGATN